MPTAVDGADAGAARPAPRTLRVPEGPRRRASTAFVADASGLSRSYVQQLISDGRLTADGAPLEPNDRRRAGAELRARRAGAGAAEIAPAPDIPLHVVYEDDDLLIVDKPAGLVVHPSPGPRRGHAGQRPAGARRTAPSTAASPASQRPGIVHRLDRDTSGLLMVAQNDAAQASLMAQLKARRVKKTYLALVRGAVVGRGRAASRRRSGATRAPHADGGGPRRPAVGHRLPRPRAVRRLDAARARPRDRPDAPDPRPSRRDRPPGRRATRSTAARPRGADPTAWGGCSCTPGGSSWRRRPTATSSGRPRRSPTSWSAVLEALARPDGSGPLTRRSDVLDRAGADRGRGAVRPAPSS